jgi:cyclohexyl-isocyanide hydratase
MTTLQIGMLMYPGMTHLDFTGPEQVLSRLENATIHHLWKSTDVVVADSGLRFVPSTTLDACPDLDVLFVGGGEGQMALMGDDDVLDFLRRQAARASWVTAVCTGSLLLGAAGLLQGKKATSHWAFIDLLPMFGATASEGRVVVDGNLVTGGGVTAGLDFAFALVERIAGAEAARAATLGLEYDPQPPFACGHPRVADAALVERVRATLRESVEERRDAVSATRSSSAPSVP